jgi:hypothetical protein
VSQWTYYFYVQVMPKRSRSQVEALQAQAKVLFDKGYSQNEVAKTLGCSVRTLQRWSKSVIPDESSVATKVTVDPVTQNALEPLIPPDLQLAIVRTIPHPPGWVPERESILQENQKYHQAVSRKLFSILDSHLDNPELNVRNIDRLSQAFTRHTNAVLTSFDHRWCDMNKALHLLAAHGFTVVDIAQMLEDREQEKLKLTPTPSSPKQ